MIRVATAALGCRSRANLGRTDAPPGGPDGAGHWGSTRSQLPLRIAEKLDSRAWFWVALQFIAAMTVWFSVPASQLAEKELSFRIRASL